MAIEPAQCIIAANGYQDVVVRFSRVTLGKNDHTVTAIANDRPVTCTLHFQGIPNLSLIPRRQIAGKLSTSLADKVIHELRIENYRGKTLDSSTVVLDASNRVLEFKLGSPTNFANHEKIQIKVSIAYGTVIRGIHFEKLLVRAGEGDDSVTCEAEIGIEITE